MAKYAAYLSSLNTVVLIIYLTDYFHGTLKNTKQFKDYTLFIMYY